MIVQAEVDVVVDREILVTIVSVFGSIEDAFGKTTVFMARAHSLN